MRNILLLGAAMAVSVSGAAQAYVTVHVETSAQQQAQIVPEAYVEDFAAACAVAQRFAAEAAQ